jgi:hypothetical protein
VTSSAKQMLQTVAAKKPRRTPPVTLSSGSEPPVSSSCTVPARHNDKDASQTVKRDTLRSPPATRICDMLKYSMPSNGAQAQNVRTTLCKSQKQPVGVQPDTIPQLPIWMSLVLLSLPQKLQLAQNRFERNPPVHYGVLWVLKQLTQQRHPYTVIRQLQATFSRQRSSL